MSKRYKAQQVGRLLVVRGAIHGSEGTKVVRLLVDTGSSFTVLPIEVLESLGYDPAASLRRVRLITASGMVVAPRLQVSRLDTLGHRLTNQDVVAYTVPFGEVFDGLLGMDVLHSIEAQVDVAKRMITVSRYDSM